MTLLPSIAEAVRGALAGKIQAARLLEQEIERRGLRYQYVQHLWSVLTGRDVWWNVSLPELYALATAGADARALAFLLAIGTPRTEVPAPVVPIAEVVRVEPLAEGFAPSPVVRTLTLQPHTIGGRDVHAAYDAPSHMLYLYYKEAVHV